MRRKSRRAIDQEKGRSEEEFCSLGVWKGIDNKKEFFIYKSDSINKQLYRNKPLSSYTHSILQIS